MVYDDAESQEKEAAQKQNEKDLIALLIERCPQVLSSKKQQKGLGSILRKNHGYRFPQQQSLVLAKLDEAEKLVTPENQPSSLTIEEKKLFQGRKHNNIEDDLYLFELVRAIRAEALVTLDENILGHPNKKQIEETFSVQILCPEDVLCLAEEEKNAQDQSIEVEDNRPLWEQEQEADWEPEWGERPK
jgi:predicted nucleic acid-binding protein